MISLAEPAVISRAGCRLLAHRDKSQSPEFTVGIDAKRTFVDKRSRPNLQRMTPLGHRREDRRTALGYSPVGAWENPAAPRLRTFQIAPKDLPPSLCGRLNVRQTDCTRLSSAGPVAQ